jgi:hypothetical protein
VIIADVLRWIAHMLDPRPPVMLHVTHDNGTINVMLFSPMTVQVHVDGADEDNTAREVPGGVCMCHSFHLEVRTPEQ